MKDILISIRPQWVEKIASGEKTIEVRKTKPKLEIPFKCLIYCTKSHKGNEVLLVDKSGNVSFGDYRNACTCNVDGNVDCYIGEGKVIGEFVCDRITEIVPFCEIDNFVIQYCHNYIATPGDKDCITFEEMKAYLGNNKGYDWHISNLKIYDKPKELSEFGIKCESANEIHCRDCLNKNDGEFCEKMIKPLTRPPQSLCYVEEL